MSRNSVTIMYLIELDGSMEKILAITFAKINRPSSNSGNPIPLGIFNPLEKKVASRTTANKSYGAGSIMTKELSAIRNHTDFR